MLLGRAGGAKSCILDPWGRGGLEAPGETGLEAMAMMEASSTVAFPTSWRAAAERSEERSMLVRLVSIDKGPTWLSGLNMVAVWTDMIVGKGGRSRSSQLGRVSGTCRACSRSHVGVSMRVLLKLADCRANTGRVGSRQEGGSQLQR